MTERRVETTTLTTTRIYVGSADVCESFIITRSNDGDVKLQRTQHANLGHAGTFCVGLDAELADLIGRALLRPAKETKP